MSEPTRSLRIAVAPAGGGPSGPGEAAGQLPAPHRGQRRAEMTDEELALLDEVISRRLGLSFPAHKKDILASRLRPRLEALRLRSFFDYYLALRTDHRDEIHRLAEAVSNNETYFFREARQLEALFGPGLEALGIPGRRRLRLLSAGCSSGEEPYSLAIWARRHLAIGAGLELDLHAFDVDHRRLETARGAAYGRYSLRALDRAQRRRYFLERDDGLHVLKEPYRRDVAFRHGNIVDAATFPAGPFDALFCRNVFIYFAEEAIHRALDVFAGVLRPGGLLFLGHSESIIGWSPRFETVRLGDCLVYRRVEG